MSFIRLPGGVVVAALAGAALVAGPAAAQAQSAATFQIPCRVSALVSAINNANSGSGGIIVLPANCNYDITAAAVPGDGLPVITGHVVLSGAHNTAIRRRAAAAFRLFAVAAGGSLSLTSITVDGGSTTSTGGGIQNAGILVVNQAVFTNNTAGNGGALANSAGGTTRVSDSEFERNTTTGVGGGAIINFADLTVAGSVRPGNTAPINGGAVNTQPGGTTRLTERHARRTPPGAWAAGCPTSAQRC